MLLANAEGPQTFLLFLFLPLFICLWILVSYIGSALGGWSALAQRYREEFPPEGKSYWMRSAKIGSIYYRSCLAFCDCDKGLGISILWIFRCGHPPLFIPWEAFHNVRQESEGFISYTGADVGCPALAHVCLPHWLEERIKQANVAKAD
ncbi:hypothetical protein K2D_40400 [Planctomycetes bacterium K2D]|uniref:Uncharacterized protein n=1 Tax=Botrimarina mediterranea TaxID=2528022 RepID=A0A518KDD6_9BACT|nr:hypothetical protein Spa11_40370 [Botrimarina mediterranea]QDV80411.1 hypothetical protein K2D_40400 [Planctomycetes bacterium K2D]